MAYRGDSDAKRIARLHWWRQASWLMGGASAQCAFDPNARFLVLASAVGGDIGVLTSLGVKQAQITAVDLEEAAIASCRQRWPDVDYRVGDVANVARAMGRVFNCALIDLCGQASKRSVDTLTTVARHALKDGAVFGWCVMVGREQPRLREQLAEVAASWPGMVTGFAGRSRNVHVVEQLHDRLLPNRIAVLPVNDWQYQSSTDESVGVPMTMMICSVVRAPLASLSGLRRRVARRMDAVGATIQSLPASIFGGGAVPRPSRTQMLDTARRLDGYGINAATALGIPRGRLAAWRAWASRAEAQP